mgnify:CR=1 FL=1
MPPALMPRVLLLQEKQAGGGVHTVTQTLCQALRARGWGVKELALNSSGWLARLDAARKCDVILACHNFKPAYVAFALTILVRKPVLVWAHGPVGEVLVQSDASSMKRAWLHWLYRRLPDWVFVSQSSRDSFERFVKLASMDRRRHTVIPNAVPHACGVPGCRGSKGPTGRPVQLAYVGRLSPEKRPDLLMEMLRLLPQEFKMTMVGDGPLLESFRREYADLLENGRLTLAGAQPHGTFSYASWDLTLLASRYEGSPMTLLESFASGVPCVGVPIPALQEMLEADAPYLLARAQSPQAIAEAVQSVLALPTQKVQADIARVVRRHQVPEFVLRWEGVLQEMVRRC